MSDNGVNLALQEIYGNEWAHGTLQARITELEAKLAEANNKLEFIQMINGKDAQAQFLKEHKENQELRALAQAVVEYYCQRTSAVDEGGRLVRLLAAYLKGD